VGLGANRVRIWLMGRGAYPNRERCSLGGGALLPLPDAAKLR
jgi:hypothetical protein